jgi:cytoskeletal protein RodZ
MNGFSAAQAEKIKEIGNYLRQQRERQSLSLVEVASATFIHLPVLEALEAGAVESLPEPVYVRGFIRRYSEVLKIDGEALIQKLSSIPKTAGTAVPPEAIHRLSESPAPLTKTVEVATADSKLLGEETETRKKLPPTTQGIPFWTYLLGLAAAVAVGAWYFLARLPAIDSPSKETPSPTVEVSPPITPSPTSPAPAASAPISATVTMVGDSWLQVKVDGKTEYEGTLAQGKTKSWSAQKQLTLKSGNAGAVSLSVNQATPQLMGSLGEIKEVVLTPDGGEPRN